MVAGQFDAPHQGPFLNPELDDHGRLSIIDRQGIRVQALEQIGCVQPALEFPEQIEREHSLNVGLDDLTQIRLGNVTQPFKPDIGNRFAHVPVITRLGVQRGAAHDAAQHCQHGNGEAPRRCPGPRMASGARHLRTARRGVRRAVEIDAAASAGGCGVNNATPNAT